MGKILVLAEKPSVGRELARVLKCTRTNNGYISGDKYIVTWALGHLVTLADPDAYDEKYKTWQINDLPMLPETMKLVVIKETSKQFKIVRDLLTKSDTDELVIATDAGREGELVARWIINKAGFRKPIKRLWISSQTDKAIQEGFRNLKPSRDYDNLFYSAQCRSEADWLVGLNVTRALTCKYNAQLSAGRVQTPTLAMVVAREKEIQEFRPKEFYTIQAATDGFTMDWRDPKGTSGRIFDKVKADELLARVKLAGTGKIVVLVKENKIELQPLAYDLTELQRDANRKYGYTAKKTLSYIQTLYEKHKIVTYPRTDSKYISDDIVPTLAERLKCISFGDYAPFAKQILRNGIKTSKRFVDNSKVSDHHAIIPTEEYVDLSKLTNEERRVYDLIVKRFLAVLSAPCQYEQTSVKVDIGGESFHVSGKIINSAGWKSVYGNVLSSDDDDSELEESLKEQGLPATLVKGQSLKINTTRLVIGKTKPPSRYNEATLLTAMENSGKLVKDRDLKAAIDNVSGIGTPATRADIIEKLCDNFYMERQGKQLHPTSKGIQLMGLVPDDLKSPELTARWEQQLALIGKGKHDRKAFIGEMKKYAGKLVTNVVSSSLLYKHDNITREKCPNCGKFLLSVKGKKGDMLVCQDRDCGYRKSTMTMSNARCPDCHKNMELIGDGDNKTFKCACGYREKLSSYTKRRSESVGKNDVKEFLSNQKNENKNKNMNTALADALAKMLDKDK